MRVLFGTVLGALALSVTLAACGSGGTADAPTATSGATETGTGASTAPSDTPASASAEIKQTDVAVAEPAVPGSGKGIKIGFLAPDASLPIPNIIAESFRTQATRAGADLTYCDSRGDSAVALNCAKAFKSKGVQGIINFQLDAAAAPGICAAGPQGLPVFAVDVVQKPCQTNFMGVDNHLGGEMAGAVLGKYFKDTYNCEYDAFLSLEVPAVGEVNDQRMGGFRDGFARFCPVRNLRKVGYDISPESARTAITDTLTALPTAHRIAVTALDDEGLVGTFSAAKAAGREDDIHAASLGMALDSMRCDMVKTPNWVASTGIFPEKYGMVGINYMIKDLKGEDVPKTLNVPLAALTASNIKSYYPNLKC